jgi:hypothetical protein
MTAWGELDEAAASLRHHARPLAAMFLFCAAGVTLLQARAFLLYLHRLFFGVITVMYCPVSYQCHIIK